MKFKIYQDKAGLYRWTFGNRNGRKMADSGEGYNTRHGARRALNRFISLIEANFEAKGFGQPFIEIVDV
jgi:uncharacterized protein YegP (UPF0339 family)